MGDESDPITAVAKAVEETAKTGGALIEAGSDLARFVGKALGTAPENTIGLLGGDYLHELRIRNLDKISRKTEEILRERGAEDPEPIGPKALLPALEAASEETDKTLQDMWANLLANAMDPDKDLSLNRVFIEALKQFEPLDALVFQQTGRMLSKEGELPKDKLVDVEWLAQRLSLRQTQLELSAGHLHKLGCVKPVKNKPGNPLASGFVLSTLGIELYLACYNNAPD